MIVMSLKQLVAERIKKARQDSGLTQSQAATLLDITQPALGYYESGQREPSLTMLERIAELYEKSIAYFIMEEMDE